MALDSDRLGNAIADAVLSETTPAPSGGDETALRDLMKAIAAEIVKEIVEHLEAEGTTEVIGGSSAGTHDTTIPEGGAS